MPIPNGCWQQLRVCIGRLVGWLVPCYWDVCVCVWLGVSVVEEKKSANGTTVENFTTFLSGCD